MRIFRIVLIVMALLACLTVLQPAAQAGTSVAIGVSGSYHGGSHGGYYGGYGHHGGYYGHGGFYGHGGYYGHGYYPYYWGGYYPSYWGLGWGWGWGYPYGVGYYGYPAYPSAYYVYGYGEVRTEVKPKEAQVYVDGGYVGTADDYDGWWQRLNLEPGKHRVVFRAQGFAPYVVTLRVTPGQDYKIKYQMQPGDDSISPDQMLIPKEERDEYGRQYKNEDRYQDRGQYGYEQDQDRYGDREQGEDRYQEQDRDQSQRDQSQYDQRRPSERYGQNVKPEYPDTSANASAPPAEYSNRRQLALDVKPADATVYIDGTYYGTGEAGKIQVMLADGQHRVEVVRPGYESFEKDIQVGENFTSNMTILLQKK